MDSNPLDRVQQRTRELTALRLRSAAVVMAGLHALILEAHRFGYSHAAIHASLAAGGLGVTWSTYKSCLRRLKRRARATAMATAPQQEPRTVQTPVPGTGQDTDASDGTPPRPSPATPWLDALQEAQRSGGRDYAPAARAVHRQGRP